MGTAMMERTFDRLIEFDPRSRQYPIRTLVGDKPWRSYSWNGTEDAPLDQGAHGYCVGYSWANELLARPVPTRADDAYAQGIYRIAQTLDDYPDDQEGSSVLAGAKAVQGLGHIREYRWAFGLDDLVRAVGYAGPAVLGLAWYSGMMRPDSSARIRPTGDVLGGHAICMPRVRVPNGQRVTGEAWLWNSWGEWTAGYGPWGWLAFDDLERLLAEQGEACIPVGRVVL